MLRKIFLCLLLFAGVVFAHKINLFAYDEAGEIFVESYFSKSAPCQNCPVEIKDGEKTLKLLTDDDGKLKFKPQNSVVSISVDGGMGHFKEINYSLKSLTKEQVLSDENDERAAQGWKIALSLSIIALIALLSLAFKRFKK